MLLGDVQLCRNIRRIHLFLLLRPRTHGIQSCMGLRNVAAARHRFCNEDVINVPWDELFRSSNRG